MKEKLLLSILTVLLSINLSFSQNFGQIGTEWYYSSGGGTTPSNSEYLQFKSVKDTIVLGKQAKKIERKHFKHQGGFEVLSPYFVYTNEDSVFIYNPEKEKFHKTFVFNVSKDDTLTLDVPPFSYAHEFGQKDTYRIVIEEVSIETYNSIELKRYKFKPLDGVGMTSMFYMDKTGGLDWFFPRGATIPEADGPLRCYHDSEVDIKFVEYGCDYGPLTSVNNGLLNNNKPDEEIYPNPTMGLVYTDIGEKISKLEVLNLQGKVILSSDKKEIDLGNIKRGTYIVKVYTVNNKTITRRIIKK